LTPKKLQPFFIPVLSRFISTRLFFVPRVENEVKKDSIFVHVVEIQEAITGELKKVQKEELSETTTGQMPVYIPVKFILYKKKVVSLIFKEISPKTYGPHCV
jgi:hypothetical protein